MCILHVRSKSQSFATYLSQSTLPVYHSYEKGNVPTIGRRLPYDDYGFSCEVSQCDWNDLVGQIDDAYAFLHKYYSTLRYLMQKYAVDDIRLDFPYYCRLDGQFFMQSDYLPPKFIKLAGDIGIGIELSHYRSAEEI